MIVLEVVLLLIDKDSKYGPERLKRGAALLTVKTRDT
jgi:hypothetical protein